MGFIIVDSAAALATEYRKRLASMQYPSSFNGVSSIRSPCLVQASASNITTKRKSSVIMQQEIFQACDVDPMCSTDLSAALCLSARASRAHCKYCTHAQTPSMHTYCTVASVHTILQFWRSSHTKNCDQPNHVCISSSLYLHLHRRTFLCLRQPKQSRWR